MNYKIIDITINYDNGTAMVKTMKQVTDSEGNTHDIGLHRFSATLEQDISDLPQNVQDVITQARNAYQSPS